MTQRKYTYVEITAMRADLTLLLTPNHPFFQAELEAKIESQLQTYMMNGTEPSELREAAADLIRAMQQARSPIRG